MYLLLSGEGATDLGTGLRAGELSEGDQFLPGPLALMIASIVEHHFGFRLTEYVNCWGLAPKSILVKGQWRTPRFAGKKHEQETTAFYQNARALARIAKTKQGMDPGGIEVVVILFRDSDGTCSAERGDWESKRKSMLDGFAAEGLATGVPMIPRPKSEAWLLCALHHHAHGCGGLEERSGNDGSPNALKDELAQRLSTIGRSPSRDDLLALVEAGAIDWRKIDMPSFRAFLDRFIEVIGANRPPLGAPGNR
ncbi:hypothetical protein [Paludisphaera sp.]|uniref:hypothetical protein n=1 Tax=Paludisphaera sp. TaxID=2017432 RepID=UPI00301CEBCA